MTSRGCPVGFPSVWRWLLARRENREIPGVALACLAFVGANYRSAGVNPAVAFVV